MKKYIKMLLNGLILFNLFGSALAMEEGEFKLSLPNPMDSEEEEEESISSQSDELNSSLFDSLNIEEEEPFFYQPNTHKLSLSNPLDSEEEEEEYPLSQSGELYSSLFNELNIEEEEPFFYQPNTHKLSLSNPLNSEEEEEEYALLQSSVLNSSSSNLLNMQEEEEEYARNVSPVSSVVCLIWQIPHELVKEILTWTYFNSSILSNAPDMHDGLIKICTYLAAMNDSNKRVFGKFNCFSSDLQYELNAFYRDALRNKFLGRTPNVTNLYSSDLKWPFTDNISQKILQFISTETPEEQLLVSVLLDIKIKNQLWMNDNFRSDIAKLFKLLIYYGAALEDKENGWSALNIAAAKGLQYVVRILLHNHANSQTRCNKGRTPLIWAAIGNHKEIIEMLLKCGANIDDIDSDGNSALTISAWFGAKDAMRILLANQADVNLRNKVGKTALILAKTSKQTLEKRKKMVEILLKNENVFNEEVYSYLTRAILAGNSRLVEHLISLGGDIDYEDDNGTPFLILALKRLDDCNYPIANISNLDVDNDVSKDYETNAQNIVFLLLQRGANVNCVNEHYDTPLITACKNGSLTIVEKLLSLGAEVNDSNNNDKTALIKASQKGFEKIVDVLLRNGAELNLQDKHGNTALILGYDNFAIVDMLLKREANVNLQNNKGWTALMFAAAWGSLNVVRLLLGVKDINVNVQNKKGSTALILMVRAAYRTHINLEIISLLLEAGADIRIQKYNKNDVLDIAKKLCLKNKNVSEFLWNYNLFLKIIELLEEKKKSLA